MSEIIAACAVCVANVIGLAVIYLVIGVDLRAPFLPAPRRGALRAGGALLHGGRTALPREVRA